MHNKFNKLTLAVAVATAAFASQAQAGGFQLNEQSTSGQGYSHAGRSSNVNDATIVFGNPAGMSFLDRAQISVGATYLDVSTDIDNTTSDFSAPLLGAASGPVEGTNEGDMVPGSTIPYGFYAQPINDRWSFGFGVYAPFGSETEYEDSFEGRYHGNHTRVEVVSAQPTLSFKFSEELSVGAGLTYNQMDGELASRIPAALVGQPPSPETDGETRVKGDDEAWGYNLGVIYRPAPETTLGLTYRSKVDYTLDGTSRTSEGYEGARANQDASLDITTPETVNFSLTQEMTDRLTLMFGASWTRWSRFDQILVQGSVDDQIINEQQNYSNAWAFATGAEYQLNPEWVLRAGLAIDNTPTNDATRSVRIPSDDRRIFSLGAGWTPVEDMTIDVAYSYLTERGTQVEQSRSYENGGTTIGTADYSADYKNEAHGFGAQLTYRF
ncbi:outer membrane protein transport protein [Halomonas sp. SH5A2]|uniref:OmpP1/FadL family transporter n=1 Tax=Halomonas sp. SH5A2 TaxID=2749040 RepID=UPI00163E51E5|nr:outer membrane protein transport protein [Halomonas sp. SH5A2]QNI01853.1 outer membrane protein transport protein [Halomonas sp. SH5A2]